jgi:uncharacterized RDD family membrane protein YckC
VSELPSYPDDAAEREAAQGPPGGGRQLSSWGRRLAAYLLDFLILVVPLAVVIVIAIAVANANDEDDGAWAAIGLAYLATIILPFIYFTFFHGDARGQTPGKRALGIRVVSDETGQSIGYGRAFGRYAITFVFGIFFLPVVLDYLWPLWDSKNQALHDKVVGSVVVRA